LSAAIIAFLAFYKKQATSEEKLRYVRKELEKIINDDKESGDDETEENNII